MKSKAHKKIGEPRGYYEEMRRKEKKLAAHYGVPFIATCSAFRSMLPDIQEQGKHFKGGGDKNGVGRCTDVDNATTALPEQAIDLMPLFVLDAVHQSELANHLQACLLAQAVLSPISSSTQLAARAATLDPLPPSLGCGSVGTGTFCCHQAQ